MNIVFFQYGNYAEAFRRFDNDGPETYRDQRVSVDYVAALATKHIVTIVSITACEHDIALTERLRSIGIGQEKLDKAWISSVLAETKADVLICRTPHLEILRQAKKRRVKTLPCFADIFQTTGLGKVIWHLRLRQVLSGPNIPCVANHSLNASRSVATCLRYPRERIVPWDWSRITAFGQAKVNMTNPLAPKAFFAGALTVDKGIGDCLNALKRLRDKGIHIAMSFAGPGDLEHWRREADELGIGDTVEFLGLISHDQVRERMLAVDIVIVPSRHNYAEGLPNTIYEGLASRSALIISDHPAFQGRLRPDSDCLIFKASDPLSLADNITRLCNDRNLFVELSNNAIGALASLYVGLEWHNLIDKFIQDPDNLSGWVEHNSLKALKL